MKNNSHTVSPYFSSLYDEKDTHRLTVLIGGGISPTYKLVAVSSPSAARSFFAHLKSN